MPKVVDYAWTKPPSIDSYSGIQRYISHDGTKDLSPAERDWARSLGKTIGLVFEATANRAAQGFAAGAEDATYANQRADSLGYPHECTLWYAVDFDAQPSVVQPYFDGIASVGGRPHAPYGGYKVIEGVRYPGLGWQTVAWSGGKVSTRAGLLQNVFGNTFDENAVLVPNFGAWGASAPQPVPVVSPAALEDSMTTVPPDGKRHDYPILSWAKRIVPLSVGTKAKVALGDGSNNWTVIGGNRDANDRAFWGNNQSFAATIPDNRRQVVEVINDGPEELTFAFDVV